MKLMKKIMDLVFDSNDSYIIVNGEKYSGNSFSGNKVNGDVSITSKGVYIDGELQEGSKDVMNAQEIEIQVFGNVKKMVSHKGDVTVDQDVGKLEVNQGDVKIGSDVLGDATCAQGDMKIGRDVAGNAKVNMGDLNITGNVGGNAKVDMGDLKIKKEKAQKELDKTSVKDKKPNSLFNLD